MERPVPERVLEFQELLLDFRNVDRRVLLPGSEELENDVDHSYFLTMTAWYLTQQLDLSLNQDKVMRYALVHDLVEVHAGDTFAFDESARNDKDHREAAALNQLESQWQDFPDLVNTIKNYQLLDDRESRFVYALDKMMPAIMSALDEGRTWIQEKLTFEQVYAYDSQRTAASAELKEFFDALYDFLRNRPDYFYQGPESS